MEKLKAMEKELKNSDKESKLKGIIDDEHHKEMLRKSKKADEVLKPSLEFLRTSVETGKLILPDNEVLNFAPTQEQPESNNVELKTVGLLTVDSASEANVAESFYQDQAGDGTVQTETRKKRLSSTFFNIGRKLSGFMGRTASKEEIVAVDQRRRSTSIAKRLSMSLSNMRRSITLNLSKIEQESRIEQEQDKPGTTQDLDVLQPNEQRPRVESHTLARLENLADEDSGRDRRGRGGTESAIPSILISKRVDPEEKRQLEELLAETEVQEAPISPRQKKKSVRSSNKAKRRVKKPKNRASLDVDVEELEAEPSATSTPLPSAPVTVVFTEPSVSSAPVKKDKSTSPAPYEALRTRVSQVSEVEPVEMQKKKSSPKLQVRDQLKPSNTIAEVKSSPKQEVLVKPAIQVEPLKKSSPKQDVREALATKGAPKAETKQQKSSPAVKMELKKVDIVPIKQEVVFAPTKQEVFSPSKPVEVVYVKQQTRQSSTAQPVKPVATRKHDTDPFKNAESDNHFEEELDSLKNTAHKANAGTRPSKLDGLKREDENDKRSTLFRIFSKMNKEKEDMLLKPSVKELKVTQHNAQRPEL